MKSLKQILAVSIIGLSIIAQAEAAQTSPYPEKLDAVFDLKSSEGNEIQLSMHGFRYGWLYATPEFSVKGASVATSSKVRVVLTNHLCGSYNVSSQPENVQIIDLVLYSTDSRTTQSGAVRGIFKGLASNPILLLAEARGHCGVIST